jgi:hypothetical protein
MHDLIVRQVEMVEMIMVTTTNQSWFTTLSDEVKDKFHYAKAIRESNVPVTAQHINKLLGTAITDERLQELLDSPSLFFPDASLNKSIMAELRGACELHHPGQCNGVYIWTHIPTGQKYVGQAFDLPTRLRTYYSAASMSRDHTLIYKLILSEDNMSLFSLKVIFLPKSDFNINLYIVEQYYLLQSAYNLNVAYLSLTPYATAYQPLHMYNADKTVLYYSSTRQTDFRDLLKISHTTFTKHLTNGSLYLDKFLFSRELVGAAAPVDLTLQQLIALLEELRISSNINKSDLGPLAKSVIFTNSEGQEIEFPSLGKAIAFLKSEGHKADQRVLVKRLAVNGEYKGYSVKYKTNAPS